MIWQVWADFYDRRLTSANKAARQNRLNRNIVKFNRAEKEQLRRIITKARKLTTMCPRLNRTPIKILGVREELENGYPHTHADTIFLPHPKFFKEPEVDQLSIFIHEWIHLYQRKFSIPFHKYLLGIRELRIVGLTSEHPQHEHVRQNPDLNDLIYLDKSTDRYVLPILRKNATNLNEYDLREYDAQNIFKKGHTVSLPENEHPFEWVAYDLTRSILSKTIDREMAAAYF